MEPCPTARQIEIYKYVHIRDFSYRLAGSALGITPQAIHDALEKLYTKKPELRPVISVPIKVIRVGRVKDYGIVHKF